MRSVESEHGADLSAHLFELDGDLDGDDAAVAVAPDEVRPERLDFDHVLDVQGRQVLDGVSVVLLQGVDGLIAVSQVSHEAEVRRLAVGHSRCRQEQRPVHRAPQRLHGGRGVLRQLQLLDVDLLLLRLLPGAGLLLVQPDDQLCDGVHSLAIVQQGRRQFGVQGSVQHAPELHGAPRVQAGRHKGLVILRHVADQLLDFLLDDFAEHLKGFVSGHGLHLGAAFKQRREMVLRLEFLLRGPETVALAGGDGFDPDGIDVLEQFQDVLVDDEHVRIERGHVLVQHVHAGHILQREHGGGGANVDLKAAVNVFGGCPAGFRLPAKALCRRDRHRAQQAYVVVGHGALARVNVGEVRGDADDVLKRARPVGCLTRMQPKIGGLLDTRSGAPLPEERPHVTGKLGGARVR